MYQHFFKRIFDFLISFFALLVFIPLFLLFIPIIYFTDRGPVFYCGERIGRNGKLFRMIKFRSMYVNAPDIRLSDGSTYNGENDPRVTPIGRFLRKTSIDELPQILNVLAGQMSLIGPRPDPPDWLDRYPEDIKVFLTVRPGITGYSQAYFRNDADGNMKMQNDAYYARNISFTLDLKIFFKTVMTVLKREKTFKSACNEENATIRAERLRQKVVEYGSEYNFKSNQPYLNENERQELPEGICYYRSGRDALKAIAISLRDRYDTILMPALCCESMVSPFLANGYRAEFYKLDTDYTPEEQDVAKKLNDRTILCVMSYFGADLYANGKLERLKRCFPKSFFVEDRTQDFLLEKETASCIDATVVSVRKWFALPDGGMLIGKKFTQMGQIDSTFCKLREDALKRKDEYLESGQETSKVQYRKELAEATERLDKEAVPAAMSEKSRQILYRMRLDSMFEDRKKNLFALQQALQPLEQDGKIEFLPFDTSRSTLYFPILCERRDFIQAELAKRNIYCPVIWPLPNGAKDVCTRSERTAKRILCLPCDHRYLPEEMEQIAKEIISVFYA